MNRPIFIKKIVYEENVNDFYVGTDNTIDKIGKMCIQAVKKLFERDITSCVDIPLFFGSAYTSLNSLHQFNRVSEENGALAVNPSLFPNTVLNSPSCRASIAHRITAPIYNISNDSWSGIDALMLAMLYIEYGEIDEAVVCVSEESNEFSRKLNNNLKTDCYGAIYISTISQTDKKPQLVWMFHEEQTKDAQKPDISTDIMKILYEQIQVRAMHDTDVAYRNGRGIRLKW